MNFLLALMSYIQRRLTNYENYENTKNFQRFTIFELQNFAVALKRNGRL